MLIYNANKEFVGIDESYLKVFGFSNLAELRAEAADFADLFVKTPGCVHNFKHVHWIDFITCGESFEKPKVIINVHSKTYTAKVVINTLFLTDNPSSKAYAIILNDLRALSSEENNKISDELLHKPIPTPVIEEQTTAPLEQVKETVVLDSYSIDIEDEDEDNYNDSYEEAYTQEIVTPKQDSFIEDKIQLPDMELEYEESSQEEFKEEEEIVEYADETSDSDYIFDPKVASEELGLPVDLIEEFIEDFIAQAKDFKEELYISLSEGNIDNVKILSHKLKGVAANLRVEDAFNHLSVVNTSSDHKEIELELNSFYRIISKLAGEEIAPRILKVSKLEPEPVSIEEFITVAEEDESDALVLEFKDEVPEEIIEEPVIEENDSQIEMDFAHDIEDEDVPQKIDLPELADDDFLATDVEPEDMKLDLIDDILIVETTQIDEIPPLSEIEEEDLDIELIEEKVIEPEIEAIIEPVVEPIVVEYPKERIASEIGLDMETFSELLEDYVIDSNALVISMKEALSQDDFAKCKKDVLVLKGMSDSMHVKAITGEIECLMNSSDKNEMTNAIEIIDNVIEQISK